MKDKKRNTTGQFTPKKLDSAPNPQSRALTQRLQAAVDKQNRKDE